MKLNETIGMLDKLFHVLSAIAFTCVGFFVMVQVITRYTPGISAPWTDELTRLFFLYSVMLGSPMAIKYHEYAVIDIITSNVKGKASEILSLFIILVVVLISFVGMLQARIFFLSGLRTVSTSLRINMGFFYIAPLMIFVLTLFYSVLILIEKIMVLTHGRKMK